MRLFMKKSVKIASALGVLPPNPRWLPAAGDSAPRHPRCYTLGLLFTPLSNSFLALNAFYHGFITYKKVKKQPQ